MKRCVASLLVIMILASNFCYAMPLLKKKETVYVNLQGYGDVSEINIYNKCVTNGESEIRDYTNYSKVTNLTNRNNVVLESGEIIFNVSGESNFSYTGKVSGEYYDLLPWNFEIIYKLNGVETKMEDLLGKSGLVEIDVNVTSNENTNPYYRNNYILEVTASYDMSDYLSVESDEAMITDTGNTKTLMFIVLPGQSTDFNIKLGSDDFSMDGITMAAVPLTGEILNQISDLVDEKNDIKDSMDSIDKSTDIILDSLSGMNAGLKGISSGVTEIKNGTKDLHGLSSLRDEDIVKLKKILEETLPLIQNVQTDLDNLNTKYNTFIEMYEELDSEVKNLQKNVENVNKELAEIERMMKNLPNDITDIKDLINSTAKLIGNAGSLIDGLDDKETAKLAKENLENIGEQAKSLGAMAGEVEDSTLAQNLISSAKALGTSAKNLENILNKISLSQVSGKATISKNLTEVKNNLYEVADILDKEDAKTIRDFVTDLKDTSETLEKMLETVSSYNDRVLENKEDITLAITNLKQLVDELSKMNTLSVSMISNVQNMLKIVSTSIYNGADKTSDAILSINNQLLNITKQSNQFKSSKKEIKNVIDNKWDKIEDETTLFNVDKDAKVISFGNEKNENVESVQFIFKTPDIKKVKEAEKDLEAEKENLTFWDRLLVVLKKMFGWIVNIF